MYNKTRVYDLSFVTSRKRGRTKPQVVFTVHATHLDVLRWRLWKIVEATDVAAYLKEDKPFHFPIDLFGNGNFGFGRCGTFTTEGSNVALSLALDEQSLYNVTLTIRVLTRALLVPFEDGTYISNERQQIDLETLCEMNRSGGYGHAVGGYVSPELIAWLKVKSGETGEGKMYCPLPKPVVNAMRIAWCAVCPKGQKKWARECTGYITHDGRFSLVCMGNATDVAIYPDDFHYTEEMGSRFGCHNLDSAAQQITLIAGLAKLCELASQDE